MFAGSYVARHIRKGTALALALAALAAPARAVAGPSVERPIHDIARITYKAHAVDRQEVTRDFRSADQEAKTRDDEIASEGRYSEMARRIAEACVRGALAQVATDFLDALVTRTSMTFQGTFSSAMRACLSASFPDYAVWVAVASAAHTVIWNQAALAAARSRPNPLMFYNWLVAESKSA